jgi:SAM-dependent methyltransferase
MGEHRNPDDLRAMDGTARKNLELFTRYVEEGKGEAGTKPWLDLDGKAFRAFAAGKTRTLPPPHCSDPRACMMLSRAPGRDVLCLASGGGQQSAVYGLLGARVTVLDLTPGQLQHDRTAAEHYGYEVTTIQGDMRDLSVFDDTSFDLIDQPISIALVPDVRVVYREVARVLRVGGLYAVDHMEPATYPTCFEGPDNGWDGTGYRIAEPYVGGPIRRRPDGSESMLEGEPIGEFRHLFCDMFNGLIESNLAIRCVWEYPRQAELTKPVEPGSEEHYKQWVASALSIVAERVRPG